MINSAETQARLMGLDAPSPEVAELMMFTFRQEMAKRMIRSGAIEYRGQAFNTPLNINIDTLKSLWMDVVVGVGFAVGSGGSSGGDTLALAVVKALGAVRWLSEDEAEVVHVILFNSKGHAYHQPISESSLRASYVDASVDLDALLASLEKKKILTRAAGEIQLSR
jgi:hypothetical protein